MPTTKDRIFKLEDLDLKVPEIDTSNKQLIRTNEGPFKIQFGGNNLNLRIQNSSSYEAESGDSALFIDSVILRDIDTTETETGSVPLITISIVKHDNTCTASTNIENQDRSVKGLGVSIWKISLKFIQNVANTLDFPVKHKVRRAPSNGLTDEKWDKIFLPILMQYNYQKKGEDLWEKVYTPEAK